MESVKTILEKNGMERFDVKVTRLAEKRLLRPDGRGNALPEDKMMPDKRSEYAGTDPAGLEDSMKKDFDIEHFLEKEVEDHTLEDGSMILRFTDCHKCEILVELKK